MPDSETIRGDATQAATFCYRYFKRERESVRGGGGTRYGIIALFKTISADPKRTDSLIKSMRDFGNSNNMTEFSPQSLTKWIDEGYVQPRYLDILTALRNAVTITMH